MFTIFKNMGLIKSVPAEALSRQFRLLSKDELTFMIYNICKNTFAKWCYPLKNPDETTQQEINEFLELVDFRSKSILMKLPDIKKAYNVPYDFYLRGLYRYSEDLENKLGTNMDKVLFEKVIGKLYGDNAACISKMYIVKNKDEYEYIFNDKIKSNFNDANKEALINNILSIYSKCRYGAIILSSFQLGLTTGHRTLIYFENVNNVLNVFYYDPHGSSELSWSNQLNIYNTLFDFFSEMKPYLSKYNIQDIVVKEFESICLFGIQTYSATYDIGMCQIFSSLWLYLVVKVIVESNKNNIQLPPTDKWIYLIDDYFISQFNIKQRYNAVLLFVSRLFNFYIEQNPKYLSELAGYNNYLLSADPKTQTFDTPYTEKSQEDIKETDDYVLKLAREGIAAARLDYEKRLRGELPQKGKRKIEVVEEPPEETYDIFKKRFKKQRVKEEEYSKTLIGRVPFLRKKKLLEECKTDVDCISGCCSYNEFEDKNVCNELSACSK